MQLFAIHRGSTDPSPAILTTTESRNTPHMSMHIAKQAHQKRPGSPADSKVQARSGIGQLHSRATSENEIAGRPKKGSCFPLRLAPRATAHSLHAELPVTAVDPANTERAPEGAKVSLCDGAQREMLTAVVPAGQSVEIDQPEAKT